MLQGIDISNLNGAPDVYRGRVWYQNAQFVIVQAIPRPHPNGLTGDQLRAARADGKPCGIYSWLWHDPNWRLAADVAEDQRLRLATVPEDVPLDMRPWLDEEDNQSAGWQVPIQRRIDDVNRALEVLDAFAAKRGLPEAGIYTSDYFVELLFGGRDYWPDRKKWMAHYGIQPGVLIGGNVVAHQYTSAPVDQDMMLESEIVTLEADVQIPQEYVDKFHLSGPGDVQGLINNFEGVVNTVREIALAEGAASAGDAQSKLDQIKQVLAA